MRIDLQSESALPAESPFDATGLAHDAREVCANLFFENGLPRNELKADPTSHHREVPASEPGNGGRHPVTYSPGLLGE